MPVRQILFAAGLSAILLAGCADNISVSSTVLTSGASIQAGKRVVATTFGHDDYVVQLTDFTWASLERDGGRHAVRFNWYKGDTLVSTTASPRLLFASSPYTVYTRRAAATLGTGRFRVETTVDGKTVSSSTFDITS